jgi:predicted double-glycine peptidase
VPATVATVATLLQYIYIVKTEKSQKLKKMTGVGLEPTTVRTLVGLSTSDPIGLNEPVRL